MRGQTAIFSVNYSLLFSQYPVLAVFMNPTDHALPVNAVAVAGQNTALGHFFQGLFGLGVFLGVSLLYFILTAIEPLLDFFKKARLN